LNFSSKLFWTAVIEKAKSLGISLQVAEVKPKKEPEPIVYQKEIPAGT